MKDFNFFKKHLISINLIYNEHHLDRYIKFIISEFNSVDKTESHHILPRTFFPEFSASSWNLKNISPRVHFIAHWMLSKAFPGNYKMTSALALMSRRCPTNLLKRYSKIYDGLKSKIDNVSDVNIRNKGSSDFQRQNSRSRGHVFCFRIGDDRQETVKLSQEDYYKQFDERNLIFIAKGQASKISKEKGIVTIRDRKTKKILCMVDFYDNSIIWKQPNKFIIKIKRPWTFHIDNKKSQYVWSVADKIIKYKQEGMAPKDIIAKLSLESNNAFYNVLKFQNINNWIPSEDKEWLRFIKSRE